MGDETSQVGKTTPTAPSHFLQDALAGPASLATSSKSSFASAFSAHLQTLQQASSWSTATTTPSPRSAEAAPQQQSTGTGSNGEAQGELQKESSRAGEQQPQPSWRQPMAALQKGAAAVGSKMRLTTGVRPASGSRGPDDLSARVVQPGVVAITWSFDWALAPKQFTMMKGVTKAFEVNHWTSAGEGPGGVIELAEDQSSTANAARCRCQSTELRFTNLADTTHNFAVCAMLLPADVGRAQRSNAEVDIKQTEPEVIGDILDMRYKAIMPCWTSLSAEVSIEFSSESSMVNTTDATSTEMDSRAETSKSIEELSPIRDNTLHRLSSIYAHLETTRATGSEGDQEVKRQSFANAFLPDITAPLKASPKSESLVGEHEDVMDSSSEDSGSELVRAEEELQVWIANTFDHMRKARARAEMVAHAAQLEASASVSEAKVDSGSDAVDEEEDEKECV
mmetsp:Transcript_44633/g.105858  ORF Transcript_44633/g.105858 Transcript_44633/m.105858 type:complete len:452 (-) Transcript_44633:24-1379(-)